MIHEAVLITEKAMLNSKSERKGYKIARLTVEKTAFEHLKKIEDDEVANSKLNHEMLIVKEKVLAHRVLKKSINQTNSFNCSRKRKLVEMDQSGAKTNAVD